MREDEKSRDFFALFDFDTNFVELRTVTAAGIPVVLGITVIY